MITGGTTWTTKLNAEYKQPLYILEFPNIGLSLCSFHPLSLITGGSSLKPILRIPQGASQSVDELNGHSNISTLTVDANDPDDSLKTLFADPTTLGQLAYFKLGFPGIDIDDFVTMHTGRIINTPRTSGGIMQIVIGDLIQNIVNDVFLNGGPLPWTPGSRPNKEPDQAPALFDNAAPISQENPRHIFANPMDVVIAVLQNELGLGQAYPPVLTVNTGGGSGTGRAGYTINPLWTIYDPENESSTLINPNPYVDIPALLALRDGQFAGLLMKWSLTSSTNGKSWIESEIFKVLGLYWLTRANGQLFPKSIKHPVSVVSLTINERQTLAIPDTERWPVINLISASLPSKASASSTNDSNRQTTFPFANQDSIDQYKQLYVHEVNAQGLRLGLGGYRVLYLLANRVFNRHGFATPIYAFKTFFKNIVLELGDFVLLSHPNVLDLKTGTMGLSNVLCEVISKSPDYSGGGVTYKVADTRYMRVIRKADLSNNAYRVSNDTDSIPDYPSASPTEQGYYMFIANSSGEYTGSIAGNKIQ